MEKRISRKKYIFILNDTKLTKLLENVNQYMHTKYFGVTYQDITVERLNKDLMDTHRELIVLEEELNAQEASLPVKVLFYPIKFQEDWG